MNRLLSIITVIIFSTLTIAGQVPERFKYQTVIRDADGKVIVNQQVSLLMEILQGSVNGQVVCSETFTPTTNEFGLVNLEIGSQNPAAFDTIDWASGPYFLKVALDGNVMGTSELLSVPYALYAKNAGNAGPWISQSDNIYYDEGNAGIGTSAPDSSAVLDLTSTSRGFLPPRLTQDQIIEITNPANGLIVFCTTDNKFYAFLESGNSWREILFGSGTIILPGSCDSNITVNHLAGNVAPVTKTVTYNIVTNVPGENSKCWLLSNLGADYQAISIDDTSEASAGWYWQFNLKQGYMHNGLTRTPNTPWISVLNENSDWISVNDPCVLELGNGWRIPTKSEWFNVDASGGWTEWNGPWNSLLKLHAGGFLNYPDAELRNRGISGSHWSSTQVNNTNGWHLDFRNINSGTYSNTKAYGISLRCIQD